MRRRRCRNETAGAEAELDLSHLRHVAVGQHVTRDRFAVDARAVFAAEIDQYPMIADLIDRAVPSREQNVSHGDVAIRASSDDQPPGELPPVEFSLLVRDDEVGHALSEYRLMRQARLKDYETTSRSASYFVVL